MKCLRPTGASALLLTVAALFISSRFSPGVRADYPETILSQKPVGYWRLDETAQPPAPSPATNSGTLGKTANGSYLFGPKRGEPGALLSTTATSVRFFNTAQDPGFGGSKVEVPYNSALNPSGAFSVEFWVKPTMVVTDAFCMASSLNSDPAIAVGTNARPRAGWIFYQNGTNDGSANNWQFKLGNGHDYLDKDAIRGGTVTPGAWHHLVGTFDGSTATLYVNGAAVASQPISGYEPNTARPFRIGTSCFDGLLGAVGTYAGNRGFDGWLEEVAFYGTALKAADVAAHYNIAQTNGAGYASAVLAQKPLGYWRLGEPGNPPALNLGTLGTNANGQFVYSAHPGQGGPQPPTFSGFEATNRAVAFSGTNGYVDIPPLNLNTNTVTITAWILADTTQTNNAGIVFCRAGTTVAGLKFDINDPNGLSYNWNDDEAAINFKSSLTVPVFQWCFVGLIVQPDQATLCLQDGTQFSTAVNYTTAPEQAFEGDTLIGTDPQDPNLTFNGVIDEVAIFNRALSVGEVYSQYASAVGGLKPNIFSDLQAPSQTVYVGDPLTLTVDAGGTPPLTYKWSKDGQEIQGVTSSSYTVPSAGTGDSGKYQVLISNAQGSTNSQPVTVTVQPIVQPQVTQDPQGRTLYQGGTLNLSVQATGGGLSYQWEHNGTNIVDATNATYRVTSAAGTDSGSYRVIVSNGLGKVPSGSTPVTVVVPSAGSYEEAILADGPEAWWRLDDPVGSTVMTDAMARHDGTYQGGIVLGVPGVLPGRTNTAAQFDGSSSYGEVPFSKALNTTNFTVECWVNADVLARALCPVASFTQPPGRGYMLLKSEDGQWFYMFGDGTDSFMFVVNGSDALYSQWVYLAIAYDGNTFTGYINGTGDVIANPLIVPNNVAPFRIGFDQTGNGWNDFWSGEIDEVAYYSKALGPDQIAAHYAAALYGKNAKPLFKQQPGSTVAGVNTPFLFNPTVEGSAQLQVQWTKNGAPIAGETNAFLVFTNLNYGDSGVYQLTASNSVGSALSAPATLAVVPDPKFANVTNGLVLHLKFDGDYTDSSGHGNNSRAAGSPTFVAGKVGTKALHYSTTTQSTGPNQTVVTAANYVTLGSPTDLQFSSNVNFSVSYWVRFSGSPGDLPFLCNAVNSYSNPGFTFAPSYQLGGWSWSLADVATSSSIGIYGPDNSINDDAWHHLAHTFDRSGSAITYLDGQEVDSRSIVPAGDLNSGEATAIGQDPSGAYPEAGSADIDDVGVWRRVLTPFEVYAIYSAGQVGTSFDTYGPVRLMMTSDGAEVQVVWQAGTLLESDSVNGTWSPVSGATAPYFKLTPGAVRKFYRVAP